MRISEIIRMVLINIRQNKFKVFLTSLGIIVGTATIVLVIAIGEGGKADVAEQFKTLNAGTVSVASGGSADMMSMMTSSRGSSGGGGGGGGGSSRGGGSSSSSALAAISSTSSYILEPNDLEDVLFFVPNIVSGAIFATASQSVFGGDLEESESYTVVGTQPAYAGISNLTMSIGEFISEDEIENVTRSVIIGANVATNIFGSVYDAYDSKLQIDGRTYVVNGVLSAVGTVLSGVNPDESIFMPYPTAEKYIFERNFSPQISVLADDVANVPAIMENISLVLSQSKPNTIFNISDAGATMDAAMESANTLSMLLLAVAVIVFIVGGIGIMNVLFVSVKERTREIGVLKAIGTKKRDILFLFILEANTIGMIGGVFGIGLSFALMPVMERVEISAIMTVEAVVLAFGFAIVTGTLFGFYPAFRASNLIPIKALNNE